MDEILKNYTLGELVWTKAGRWLRVKELSAGKYELAQLAPGYCGEKSYNPKIDVEFDGANEIATFLYDNTGTPVKQLSRNAETAAEIDTEFTKLKQIFKDNLQEN
ncbi:MAG: hypothetical protein LBN08_02220 [Lactobacillales bacterium]|jgi:hypothetical protein|nr:hypothetical protein [Lactobacillales bacterium]